MRGTIKIKQFHGTLVWIKPGWLKALATLNKTPKLSLDLAASRIGDNGARVVYAVAYLYVHLDVCDNEVIEECVPQP